MTNTSIIEEFGSSSPVLEQLGPAVEKQIAKIIGAAEVDEVEEAPNTLNLGYSVPIPGVRYYTYL